MWVKTFFFFALHLILGEKSDYICSSNSDLCSSQIFWSSWPPLFKILRTLLGTNNIISTALRNKAQGSFQPVKAQRKMRNLIIFISKAQRNFRNELFDSARARGIFRGGGALCHGPPLWFARIAKLHRKVGKIEACPPPPPLEVVHKVWSHIGHVLCVFSRTILRFGRKIGLVLSEDLFFCSSPNFGQFLIQNFVLLKFSKVSAPPPPPLFQNPAYATG